MNESMLGGDDDMDIQEILATCRNQVDGPVLRERSKGPKEHENQMPQADQRAQAN